MKSVRIRTPGPVREGTEADATVRIFGIAVDRPGHDLRVVAAARVRRSATKGCSEAAAG